jgi:hypothetical protein
MGLDYSYEIVCKRSSVTLLVQVLAKHVRAEDADRLLSAVRETPDRLMELARRQEYGEACDLCLSFLFEPDEKIILYQKEHALYDPITRRAAIGCVWSSFEYGEHYALFCVKAATSDMSRLFESSPNVRAAFIRIALEAGALLLAFDDEQGDLVGVWPLARRAGICVVDDLPHGSEPASRVDLYCDALLKAFGIDGNE